MHRSNFRVAWFWVLILWISPPALHAFNPPGSPPFDLEDRNPRFSPDAVWERLDAIPAGVTAKPAWIRHDQGRPFKLSVASLNSLLAGAPQEGDRNATLTAPVIRLPMPDGSFARFRFVDSPVMAPELAAKFPEIKTYLGVGVDDPLASVRFDSTPAGFHAQILSPNGAVYVDPYSRDDTEHYTSVAKKDVVRGADDFVCLAKSVTTMTAEPAAAAAADALRSSGNQLRIYRLAVAATGEYTTYHGGTVAAGMAAIVTAINRVDGVYENELAIRLVLVANNDLVVYTNGSTDPYSNGSGSTMLGENQANLDAVIGSANYDLGHVFSTGGGGIASLGSVCSSSVKARGVTGLSNPVGDGFYIDYVAHEMGHQFGANHTFNSESSSCSGNRVSTAAYEPGSGSTIMAYAGICSPDNLQTHSDPYFHWMSYDEIMANVTTGVGSLCPTLSATANNIPTVSAGANHAIPYGTPFTLTATGSDGDGDSLTYCWEERDLGAATTLATPDNGASPLFRTFNPTANASRTFPQLSSILSGSSSLGERLPTTSRTLAFRVTVRDNRPGGGGVNSADRQLTVTTNAGPFVVTSPNTAVNWSGLQTIVWNVAGTTNAPVNAQSVNLLLSADGGQTFPHLLASNTPNDGVEQVVLPNLTTATARLKIAATSNVFFDVSDVNFSVQPGPPLPLVQIVSANIGSEGCAPTNGVADPGEVVTLNLALQNGGTANTTNLVVTLLDFGGVTHLGSPQSYGALAAGGSAVTQAFPLIASGVCGGAVTAVFQLQDGAASLGLLTNHLTLGLLGTQTASFTNATAITVPVLGTNKGPGSVYPSPIIVSSVAGTLTKVTVTLRGLSHSRPDDLDVLLVGPGGQTVLLMSDAGGTTAINNLTLAFDDAAANSLPDSSTFTSGTWKPSNYGTSADMPDGPAAASYGTNLAVFSDTGANGTWSLYVDDDSLTGGGTGTLGLGWSLNLSTLAPLCCGSAMADVAITTPTPTLVTNVGGVLTVRYAITNAGPDSASSVAFADPLPTGLQFLSAVSTLGICLDDNGVVRCALGALAAGQGAVITLQLQATTNGVITNLASVTTASSDPLNANNSSGTVLTLNAVPLIMTSGDETTLEDIPLGPLEFLVYDEETPAGLLTVTASSSNPAVISQDGILVDSNEFARTLVLMPQPDASGETTITLIVSDGAAQATNQFLVTVLPVNDPPDLAPIPDQAVDEGTLLTFGATASDVETPTGQLAFTLGANSPAGAQVSLAGGVFTWMPGDTQGPSTNLMAIIVTDSGVPTLSATQTFTVVVREVNQAPQLAALPAQTVGEGSVLSFTNTASDADFPTNQLTFTLGAGTPAGAVLNSVSGVFTWTPGETNGPGTNSIAIVVTDNGTPTLSATQLVSVIVTELNSAPTLDPVAVQVIAEGATLTFTNVAHDPDVPTNTLTFSLGVGAPAGAALSASSGVFTWMPGETNGPGTNSIAIVVTDNGTPALSATQLVSVIVTELNSTPTLDPVAPQMIAEGATLTFTAMAHDPDVPTNQWTFAFGAGAPVGATVNPATGVFTWTPGETNGPSTNAIAIVVTDNGAPALSATQLVSVIVTELNSAPTLDPVAPQMIAEGATLTFTVVAHDSDVPTNALTFSLGVGAPAGAALSASSGVFTWTPGETNGPSTNSIAIVVTDNGTPTLSATQLVSVIVTELNSAPTLDPVAPQTIAEGATLTFTVVAHDSDVPTNALTFSLGVGAPAGAALSASSGVFTWMPGETNGPGTNSIAIVVTDNGTPALSATQLVSVIVTELNSTPTLDPVAPQMIAEGATLTFTAMAHDPDVPTNQWTFAFGAGAPVGATVNPATGVFTWTPGETNGPSTNAIAIVVTDNGAPALSATQLVSVIVTELNSAPTLDPVAPQMIAEGATLTFTVVAHDSDVPTNALTFSLGVGAPAGAALSASSGVFTWTPGETNGPSTNSIAIVVTDNGTPTLSATQLVSVIVTELNSAPTLDPVAPQTIAEGATLTFTAMAHDPDVPTNALTFSLGVGAPAGAALSASSGVFTWTPGETNGPSTNAIAIVVTDNGAPALSATQLVSVIVTELNSAPTLDPVAVQVIAEGATLTFTAMAHDPDVPTNQWTFAFGAGAPVGATVNPATGVFTWTPGETNGPSTNAIAIVVTDNGAPALSATQLVSVIVTELNSAPTLDPVAPQTIAEGAALTFTAIAHDPDVPTNALTFSLGVGAPAGAALSASSGVFTWTPGETNGPSTNTIAMVVTDNGTPALSATQLVSVIVTELNSAPTLDPVTTQTIAEGATLTFTNVAHDPDVPTNQLTFTLGAGAPAGATINSTTGVFTWTPGETNGPGTNAIAIVVTDNGTPALSATQLVSVIVTELNSAPTLDPVAPQMIAEGATLTFTAMAHDPDVPTNQWTFAFGAGAPVGATVNPATGVFTWTPGETNGPSTNSIAIVVTDNGTPALSATQLVSVIVTELNSAPTLDPVAPQMIAEGATLTFTVVAHDSDVPTNQWTFAFGPGAPAGATLSATTGVFTWTPAETDGPGTNTIAIVVTDNGTPALSATQLVSVIVTELNSAPTLDPVAPQTIAEGATLTFTAMAHDPDVPTNALTFSLGVGAPAGAALSASSGVFTWMPGETNGPGTNSIAIVVTDNGTPALSATQLVSVIVTELNSTPTLDPVAPQMIAEGATLTFTAMAHDPDVPTNQWTFAFGAGAPVGATVNPATGVFTWTPGETNGPSTNAIAIVVTDNGAPALSATQLVSVIVTELNSAPTLDPVAPQMIAEGATLTFTVVAHDSDVPTNQWTFAFGAGAPAGAVLDSASGVFTWTPGETNGPGTNTITIVVTDNGTPALSATQVVIVVVQEVNLPPVFAKAQTQTVAFGSMLVVTNVATDPDIPTNTLTFQFGAPAPAGAHLDPVTGVFTWTPTDTNQIGTNSIALAVADNGLPPLSATQHVTVVVTVVNRPPSIAPLDSQTIAENTTLTVTNVVTDPGMPPAPLMFSLGSDAPVGAVINATNGILTWTPSEVQGPSSNVIAIILTSEASPALSTTQNLAVIVTEVNQAPQLTVPADRVVYEGEMVALTATATDADIPTNQLAFALVADVPSGASINSTNGFFTWSPGPVSIGSTHTITVRVQDDGLPVMEDTRSFTLAVAARPRITSLAAANGTVTLQWSAVPGRSYRVQFKAALEEISWTDLPGDVLATGNSAEKTDAPDNTTRYYRVLVMPE